MSKQEFYEACESAIFAKSCLSKTKLIIKDIFACENHVMPQIKQKFTM